MGEEEKDVYLDRLIDEYYSVGYEDVIGGKDGSEGVITRFKYKKVPREDFGLSNEDILLLEDKQLNQVVSIKKYRTYREPGDNKVDKGRTVHYLNKFKKEKEE